MTAPNELQPNRGVDWNGSAEHDALLAIALTAAEGAAAVIRERAADAGSLEWRAKATADFVSDVDTAAEQMIREVVARDAPGAVIIGEELSPTEAASAAAGVPTFIVDPLDGTTNFLHGYPAYAVSVGVMVSGELAAGAIVNVVTRDVFTAVSNGGARRNGEPIHVSQNGDPGRALVGTGFPFKNLDQLDRYARQFAAVTRQTAGIRRAGSAALDLADVAMGRFDAFWELILSPWDFAAGMLLIREAGGVVTDLEGNDVLPGGRGSAVRGQEGAQPGPGAHLPAAIHPSPIVAGSAAMHAWLMRALADA